MINISPLKNPIQEYDWGSRTAIAELLGQPTPSPGPQAELWMGAHPKAPSLVLQDGRWVPLQTWIDAAPEDILGPEIAARFCGKLPFLFKVLAAAQPLSIQAHPNRTQARQGYAHENSLGIPPDAGRRNYRDDNHKPELICALSTFLGLKGFRSVTLIQELINRTKLPHLVSAGRDLLKESPPQALQHFLRNLMSIDQMQQHRLIAQVVSAAEELAGEDDAYDWVVRLNRKFPGDIGVLSPLFLNLFRLQPGEAMFIDAGTLHAYLSGVCIEIMANSDNVLRGGLTNKHVDTDELLRTLRFVEEQPELLPPKVLSPTEMVYLAPAEEFVLSSIQVKAQLSHHTTLRRSVEILICIQGGAAVINTDSGAGVDLHRGDSVIIPASVKNYRITGQANLYTASARL
jgi:mannose-6-phosphate isomerase